MKKHLKYMLASSPIALMLLVGCGGGDVHKVDGKPVTNIVASGSAATVWWNYDGTNTPLNLSAVAYPEDATNKTLQWWATTLLIDNLPRNLVNITPGSGGTTATVSYQSSPGGTPSLSNRPYRWQGTSVIQANATDGSFVASNTVTVNVAQPLVADSMREYMIFTSDLSRFVGFVDHGDILDVYSDIQPGNYVLLVEPRPYTARFKNVTMTTSNTNIATVGAAWWHPINYDPVYTEYVYENLMGFDADEWEDELWFDLNGAYRFTIPATVVNQYGQTTITLTSANRATAGSFTIRRLPPS